MSFDPTKLPDNITGAIIGSNWEVSSLSFINRSYNKLECSSAN